MARLLTDAAIMRDEKKGPKKQSSKGKKERKNERQKERKEKGFCAREKKGSEASFDYVKRQEMLQ